MWIIFMQEGQRLRIKIYLNKNSPEKYTDLLFQRYTKMRFCRRLHDFVFEYIVYDVSIQTVFVSWDFHALRKTDFFAEGGKGALRCHLTL